MVDGQPDHGFEVVQPVAGVIATASEDHTVDASPWSRRRGALLQCICQLDLVATTGRGPGEDLEYRRVEDVAPDDRKVAWGVSRIGFLDQPSDANHGPITLILRPARRVLR